MPDDLMRNGLSQADLILLALLFIGWPLAGEISRWRSRAEDARNDPEARIRSYNAIMIGLSATALAILISWAAAHRPWAEIGFNISFDLKTKIVVSVTGLIILSLFAGLLKAAFSEAERAKLRDDLAKLKDADLMVPFTGREYRRAMLASFTAGVAEEIIFRAYLIWALSQLMHQWLAALAALLLFVFLHRYQGLRGMAQVGLLGAVFTVLYLAGGSLWPVIALHILVNVLNLTRLRIAVTGGAGQEA